MAERVACRSGEVELGCETVLGFLKRGKSITWSSRVALVRGLLDGPSDDDGIEGIPITITIAPALMPKFSIRSEAHTWA